jgi:uncharacterized protein (TIGR02246 family)
MNSQTTQSGTITPTDEATIRAIPLQMVDGWHKGSGEAFAAPFAETADFFEFEGTHLQGREAIAAFHQQIIDTLGERFQIEIEVKCVRFLNPQLAVMHAVARMLLPGQTKPSPSRDSMELFVVRKYAGAWRIEAFQNCRRLTLERQLFLDDLDTLPTPAQRQVADLVASLKQRHQRAKEQGSLPASSRAD